MNIKVSPHDATGAFVLHFLLLYFSPLCLIGTSSAPLIASVSCTSHVHYFIRSNIMFDS